MTARRTIVWWSTGAASAMAARLILKETPKAIIARCETNGVRIFIDEIPDNWPMTHPIAPACDFLCYLVSDVLEK